MTPAEALARITALEHENHRLQHEIEGARGATQTVLAMRDESEKALVAVLLATGPVSIGKQHWARARPGAWRIRTTLDKVTEQLVVCVEEAP